MAQNSLGTAPKSHVGIIVTIIILLAVVSIGGTLFYLFYYQPKRDTERARDTMTKMREARESATATISTPTAGTMKHCTQDSATTTTHLYTHGPRVRLAIVPKEEGEPARVYIYDGAALALFDSSKEPPAWGRVKDDKTTDFLEYADIVKQSDETECHEQDFDALLFRRQEDPVAQETP